MISKIVLHAAASSLLWSVNLPDIQSLHALLLCNEQDKFGSNIRCSDQTGVSINVTLGESNFGEQILFGSNRKKISRIQSLCKILVRSTNL